MKPVSEELPATIPPCPDSSGESGVAPRCSPRHDSFLWRQLGAAGLGAVAEKVVSGQALELHEALALSHASLPLLGKIVQLRPGGCVACGPEAEVALPIDRAAVLPDSPRRVGQPLADWESFCRTLIAMRGQVSSAGAATAWYPIVGQPLDRDHGCAGGFTGVEVLRAIALARLVLPAEIQVWAPLAVLGPKLAQVALDFGASHLGCVALDGQTPNDPLVADPSVLDELLGSCLPTSLKEQPD